MVKRAVKKIFHKKFSRIGETAFLLALFTLLSQFLALFRDRFLTGKIGAGESLDIYYAAFRIPDIVFVLGASLVSVSMLMPFFKEKMKEGEGSAKDFFNGIFTAFSIFIILVNIIIFFLIPFIVPAIFHGFSVEAREKIILLSRIMLLSPLLLGVSNIFSTVVQSFQKFFVYALAPVFYNFGIIVGILVFYPLFGIVGLAYGVILGAFLHLFIQFLSVRHERFIPHFSLSSIRWKDLKKIVQDSLPRTLTLSVSRIMLLVLVAVASTFISGSVSLFQLSFNLQSVPLSLIGVAYSVAAFPVLVSFFQEKKYEDFAKSVFIPIRQIIFWSLPVIFLFIVLRAHIIRVVLGTSRFSWNDTRITAASLAILVFAVLAQGINFVFIRAYYAAGKTWRPFFVNLFSFLVGIATLFILLPIYEKQGVFRSWVESTLKVKDLPGSEILILSMVYVFTMYLSLLFFTFLFPRDFPFVRKMKGLFKIKRSFFESLLASIFLGGGVYIMLHYSVSLFNQHRAVSLLLHALFSSLFPFMIWFAILFLTENEDFLNFIRPIKKVIFSLFSKKRKLEREIVGEINIPS